MDFVSGLPFSADWKDNSYDSILVIVNQLNKMVYYKLVKVLIDAPEQTIVILDIVVWYHGLPDSIVTDRDPLFILKF